MGQLRSWHLGNRTVSPVSRAALVAKGKGAADNAGLGATVDTANVELVTRPVSQNIFGGLPFAYWNACPS